jgi:Flp pilus assembly protein CpaB
MRASTLFAITAAVFLGLAVVAAAKYSGIFSPKAKEPPPPKVPLKVLVAAKNLFENMTILPGDVRVRDMSDEEEAAYKEHREKYLPPKVDAGIMRVLIHSVEADQPILREYLEDINLPQSLNRRLSSPSMRAVNISVPIDRADGGLIQRGEYVDVYLTTRVSVVGKPETSITETAAIARNLKVIVKRNMLWNALAAVDPKKPIDYTLEANPYRAALIEFARTKGELSLVTTAIPQESMGFTSPTRSVVSASQSDPTSKEYQDEDKRVAEFVNGERPVGDADLERIFNLKPIRMSKPIQIETYNGVHYRGVHSFGPSAGGPMRPITSEPSYGYQFAPVNTKENGAR